MALYAEQYESWKFIPLTPACSTADAEAGHARSAADREEGKREGSPDDIGLQHDGDVRSNLTGRVSPL